MRTYGRGGREACAHSNQSVNHINPVYPIGSLRACQSHAGSAENESFMKEKGKGVNRMWGGRVVEDEDIPVSS